MPNYKDSENKVHFIDSPEFEYLLPAGCVQITDEEALAISVASITPLTSEQLITALWQAAHDYEVAEISGSAVGLLAMGVLQGKPKCTAVQNWIKGIWTEYYTRKAGTETSTDYSVCGACPYTVPELMAELGV